jgi:uncharacterized membrane protein
MQHAQTNRLYELDAAKFIAMLLMMVGHVLDALVRPSELDIAHLPWSAWHWWRGITAPVFLTISGMLFALTLRRNDCGNVDRTVLRRRMIRALQLAAIGYVLVFPARHIFDLPFVDEATWRASVQVNILQLVAASLLLLVLLAVLFPRRDGFRRAVLVGGIAIAVATPLVHRITWYEHLPSLLAAYISYEGGSLFPIFPFSAYMLLGAWLGCNLTLRSSDRIRWLRQVCFFSGGALVLVGAVVGMWLPIGEVDLYRYTPIGVGIRQGVALLFIATVSLALPLLRSCESLLVLFGKQALAVYVLHLLLLFGTPWFDSIGRTHFKMLSLGEGILAAAAIVVATLGSILAWQRVRSVVTQPSVLRLLRVGMAVALAYLLLA